ncbi:hypothetical protein K474DRAFT_1655844 [Panus rudis PR-1116 ss-1]|nr:hypothetical protein K474DRAFT_1655844 [Panus rudis PR-1116 ss-1]
MLPFDTTQFVRLPGENDFNYLCRYISNKPPEVLLPGEDFWRDHQPWLAKHGYQLRPRYHPNWVPSWTVKSEDDRDPDDREDGIAFETPDVLDATRMDDGEIVMLKRLSKKFHPHEVAIGKFFSTVPIASNPRNHCVPILDVLQVPDDDDVTIIVMPLLREFDSPKFETVGEAVAFFIQVFEGLQFMHEHNVAHRDCMNFNIMMDPKPIFPNGFHPRHINQNYEVTGKAKYYSRTERPPKYYLIDFGLSRQYPPGVKHPLEPIIFGGDKSVPEFVEPWNPCDPFPTDIYYIGNMIQYEFLQKIANLEFMRPLVADMVHTDPKKRPDIHEVVKRFEQTHQLLPWWTLRSRLQRRRQPRYGLLTRVKRTIRHLLKTMVHILLFRPAIPLP